MSREASPHDSDPLPPAPFATAVAILRPLLRTTCLAIHQVRAGRLECLYCSPKFASQAQHVWNEQRPEILGGETVRANGIVYLPIIDERVVGVLEAADGAADVLDVFQSSLLACTLRALPEVLKCAALHATTDQDYAIGSSAATGASQSERETLGNARRVMRLALNEVEKIKLKSCLDRHKWVISDAARELRVNRATVYRKMAIVGIARSLPSPKDPARRPRTRLLPRTS